MNAGLCQKQVARALHVRQNTVSDWERGETQPRLDKLRAFAQLCEVPVCALIGDDSEHACTGATCRDLAGTVRGEETT
jgi:transcriptional regulator with XRE-family HTH domain